MDESEFRRRYQAERLREESGDGEVLALLLLGVLAAAAVFVAHGLYTGDWMGWLESIVRIRKAAP